MLEGSISGARRVLMFANPACGILSPSWRFKCALESQGYCVFWFTPKRWPELFSKDIADASFLDALCKRWGIGLAVACDGIGVRGLQEGVPLSVLALTEGEYRRSLESSDVEAFDYAFTSIGVIRERDNTCDVIEIESFVDSGVSHLKAANTIAAKPSICLVQSYSDLSEGLLERLSSQTGLRVIGAGEGWPDAMKIGQGHSDLFYALSSAREIAIVDDSTLDARQLHVLQCYAAMRAGRVRVLSTSSVAGSDRFLIVDEFLCDYAGQHSSIMLEVRLSEAIDAVFSKDGSDEHFAPCRVGVLFGYVGKGNFGDELILSTIATRMEARCPGCILFAVGEDPWHTLVHRGIYSIRLEDSFALDTALSVAAVSVVIAGLLFDQGIRWTMGKAELVSTLRHSDIPGIASFVELSNLNDVPCLFYGIGAGPLELDHSKRLVRFMGDLGARFLARDIQSSQAILEAGAPVGSVERRADVAFTSAPADSSSADEWLLSHGLDANGDLLVAISLREYENVPDNFDRRVSDALDRVASAHANARFLFCILDKDDVSISKRIVSAMRHSDRAFLYDTGEDIDAMAGMFQRCHSGLSMRYHCSLVLAKAGVPCVGLGYLPKVVSLYEEIGLGDFILKMDVSGQEIAARLEELLNNRPVVVSNLSRGVRALTVLAQESEDELAAVLDRSNPVEAYTNRDVEVYLSASSGSYAQIEYLLWREWSLSCDLETRDSRILELDRRIAELEQRTSELADLLEASREHVRALEESTSYKIGSALTYVPGRIKSAMKRTDPSSR